MLASIGLQVAVAGVVMVLPLLHPEALPFSVGGAEGSDASDAEASGAGGGRAGECGFVFERDGTE